MKTLLISGIPRRAISVSMLLSIFFRKTSSSADSSFSSPFGASSFIIRIRRISFSALSSLNMQVKSSSNSRLIFSAMSAMLSFLSTIISRFNSIRSNQGEIFSGATSSSGIS
uniref:Uncharacterized protein MANES_01G151000 n=1 Tax=Rhizophora mucronata TaxID=61149 RepID=A0A2P2KW60_RHIMU